MKQKQRKNICLALVQPAFSSILSIIFSKRTEYFFFLLYPPLTNKEEVSEIYSLFSKTQRKKKQM